MKKIRVGIVGFGNMGSAIGLALKRSPGFSVAAFEKDPQKRKNIRFLKDIRSLVSGSDVVILALKPQDMPQFLLENKVFFIKFPS